MPPETGPGTPETAASSGAPGALPDGTGRPGKIHPACSWPSLAPSSHTVRMCRHLSVSKLEDGGTAPSGRHCPIGGLFFRGPACGSTPYPVTSFCQFLVPSPITSPREWGTALGLDRNREKSERLCASIKCPNTSTHKPCLPKSTKASTVVASIHTNIAPPPPQKKPYRSGINKNTAL